MSLTWTVLGTVGELLLAYFLFMLVAVSGGALANGAILGKLSSRLLNLAIFALPGACVASATLVIIMQAVGADASAYWWYAMPLAATGLYLAYVALLTRRNA